MTSLNIDSSIDTDVGTRLMKKGIRLIIKIPYSTPYLYVRYRSGPQIYIAKLNEIDVIAKRFDLSRQETFDLLLELVKRRLEKTQVSAVRETLESILFDPSSYFS